MDQPISDSEWLAEMSMRALADGRIELALAVLRLTVQVRRVERDSAMMPAVPVVPGLVPAPRVTPEERIAEVARIAPEYVRPIDRSAVAVAPGDGSQGASDERPTAVTPSARCIVLGANNDECRGVIYWTSEGWRHLDHRSDNHHRPQADRAVSL